MDWGILGIVKIGYVAYRRMRIYSSLREDVDQHPAKIER